MGRVDALLQDTLWLQMIGWRFSKLRVALRSRHSYINNLVINFKFD